MKSALRPPGLGFALALLACVAGGCSSARKKEEAARPSPRGPAPEVVRAGFSKSANGVALQIPLDSLSVRRYWIRDLPPAKYAYSVVVDPGGLLPRGGSVRLTFRTPAGEILSSHFFRLTELPDLEHYRARGRIQSEALERAQNFDLEVIHSAAPKSGRPVTLQLQGVADGSLTL